MSEPYSHATHPDLIKRLATTVGTAAEPMLAGGLGANIGGMFEAELDHFVRNEWATTANDVLWRRTKMGLHIGAQGRAAVARWFGERPGIEAQAQAVGKT